MELNPKQLRRVTDRKSELREISKRAGMTGEDKERKGAISQGQGRSTYLEASIKNKAGVSFIGGQNRCAFASLDMQLLSNA